MRDSKVLVFDVETTGLDAALHDIVQFAGMMVINGRIEGKRDFLVRPFNPASISDEAMEIHGRTVSEVLGYPPPLEVQKEICVWLGQFIDKYNKADKAWPMAYNGRFDMDFLSRFWQRCADAYLGSWINWRLLDPLALAHLLDYHGTLSLPDYKLSTLATQFDVPLRAHDALSDCTATWEVWGKLHGLLHQTMRLSTL